MNEAFQFEKKENPEWELIGGGIHDFNMQQAGNDSGKTLCFVVRNPEGQMIGGVIGETYWNWLYISLMWIKEEYRGQGLGQRLLALAEEEGQKRGAEHAYLDTFSFQAPEFYKKYGWRVFGELPNFPGPHTRTFMTKDF